MLALAILSVSLCACKPDPDEPNGENLTPYESEVVMGAHILQGNEGQNGPRRVHLGQDNTADHSLVTDILWSADDEIACWCATKNAERGDYVWAPYHLISGADTKDATFRGNAVHSDDDQVGKKAMRIDYAIYPMSCTDIADNVLSFPGNYPSNVYFTMPATQMYQAPLADADGNLCPTFKPEYNVMVGRGDGSGTTRFQSTCGILLLRIKGSTFLPRLDKLKLVSRTDEKLWGKFSAAIDEDASSTITYVSAGGNELILDCSNVFGEHQNLPDDKFTNFYFLVPPHVFQSGFTIYMETDGDSDFAEGQITTTKNNEIHQSDIKVMPALELSENVTLTWSLDDLYNQGTVTEL